METRTADEVIKQLALKIAQLEIVNAELNVMLQSSQNEKQGADKDA